jgi:hypothetical protein
MPQQTYDKEMDCSFFVGSRPCLCRPVIMRHLLPAVFGVMLVLAVSSEAKARTLALLVGVADYDTAGIHDLLGPRNDVTLMWRALKARQVAQQDIVVLSDGLPAGPDYPVARALPHRVAILDALDHFAGEVRSGDTVVFYYSGHGAVQPVRPDDVQEEPEADGNDQVILPADVGPYDIITRTIRNAIVDNELQAKFDAIRSKGAVVWAVVDACHSGTVTRGDDVVRTVDPGVLGVPPANVPNATRGGSGPLSAISLAVAPGGITGFYAVEAYAEAIERPFTGYDPKMVGEGAQQRMGVFTFHLHRALMRNSAATFRDLAQEIVADLNSDRSGGKVPPPVFDGDLEASLFGSIAEGLPGAITGTLAEGKLRLAGGILHGFDLGSEVALYVPGDTTAPVAHARISEATAVTSTATELVWVNGASAKVDGAFAVVVSAEVASFRFRVAPPPEADFADAAERRTLETTLHQLFTGDSETLGIELAAPGDPDADLLLRVKDHRVWVLRPDRPWVETANAYQETPSLALQDDAGALQPSFRDVVWRLARAARLLRVASAESQSLSTEAELQVAARIIKSPGHGPLDRCPKQPVAAAVSTSISPLLPAAVSHCDLVEIEVTNDSDRDYYISGFYVDSLGGIAVVPRATEKSGCVRTLPMASEKPLRFSFWINTWDHAHHRPSSVGPENFVLLATPKDDSRQPPRLCALLQPTLTDMQKTRAADMPSTRGQVGRLQSLLGSLDGVKTRGADDYVEQEGAPAITSRVFVFDVRW